MQPGISRAVPAGILGFLLGALLVVIIRAFQGLEPFWHPGSGIIMGAFISSALFVWGIGAFDPRWSVHGEGHHDETALATTEPTAEPPPRAILGMYMWRITSILLVVLLVLAFFAFIPNDFQIITTDDPVGSVSQIGTIPFTIGETQIEVSELTLFAGFVVFTLVSLAAIAGVMALMFYILSRFVTEAKTVPPTDTDRTPPMPVRMMGRGAGWLARRLRNLPRALGQK